MVSEHLEIYNVFSFTITCKVGKHYPHFVDGELRCMENKGLLKFSQVVCEIVGTLTGFLTL